MAKVRDSFAVCACAVLVGVLAVFPSSRPGAERAPARWSKVNIPAQGEPGKWVLARGADVRQLAVAADGALYAAADPAETDRRLFRSSDGGVSWRAIGEVTDTIVSIATAPDDARLVYYATSARVYRSADAGATFAPLPAGPGGAGSDNRTVTALTVAARGNGHVVAVAVCDSDAGQPGGVYILDEAEVFPAWRDTSLGLEAVAVAFSPRYSVDRALVAVAANETDTLVLTRIGEAGWASLRGAAVVPGVVARVAAIAFPDDYVATADAPTLFVGIDSGAGAGDVYRVVGRWRPTASEVTDLNVNADVSGLLVSGSATGARLVAGMAGSAAVSVSQNGGQSWQKAVKPPTGQSTTRLAAAPDFATNRCAYAGTSGAESAFSRSDDGGTTWDQLGLIDTEISTSAIIDLAVSPEYARDNTLFMLTWGGEHSLWRSRDGGGAWERVFSSAGPDIDAFSRVALSPGYGRGSRTVFVTGTAGGRPALWRSSDSGQTFVARNGPGQVDAWVIASDDRLFVATYDGSRGLIFSSEDGGFLYGRGAAAGSQPLNSIAVSPNFESDRTLAAGNTVGSVYLSRDGGASFERLGQPLPLAPGGVGLVSLAFDPGFATNKLIYAATDAPSTSTSRSRLFRFVVGRSDAWEAVDASLPVGGMIGRLAVSTDGVLYAASAQAVSAANGRGGMERSLDPTSSLSPTFETVAAGLDDGATLVGLWSSGNCLWSIDTTNTRLMVYVDTLTHAPVVKSPTDRAAGLETTGIRLEWSTLDGATSYEWQLSDSGSFSSLPSGFSGTTAAASARLPALDLAATYYWRVRASEPVLSPWSAKGSFMTKLGSTAVAPVLQNPPAGAEGVPLVPVFQWSAIAGAQGYELVVSANSTFNAPLVSRTGDGVLPSTAWQSDVSLEPGVTYYWRVRAVGSGTFSAWSGTGAFTTKAAPAPTTAVSPPSTAVTSPAPAGPTSPTAASSTSLRLSLPGWAIFLAVLLGVIVVLLLALIVLLLVRRRNEL